MSESITKQQSGHMRLKRSLRNNSAVILSGLIIISQRWHLSTHQKRKYSVKRNQNCFCLSRAWLLLFFKKRGGYKMLTQTHVCPWLHLVSESSNRVWLKVRKQPRAFICVLMSALLGYNISTASSAFLTWTLDVVTEGQPEGRAQTRDRSPTRTKQETERELKFLHVRWKTPDLLGAITDTWTKRSRFLRM